MKDISPDNTIPTTNLQESLRRISVAMEPVRDKKMSLAQMERMLDLIERKPELATGGFSGPHAKKNLKQLWEAAALELNSEVGSNKSGEKWQKAWADWKSKTRAKVRTLSSQNDSTPLKTQLTDLEVKLISILDTFGWTSINIDEMADGNMPAALDSPRDKKMSVSQMDTLVDLMKQNPELASGRLSGPMSKEKLKNGWSQIALTLNTDTNGPSKSGDKWQKAWKDWKSKTRTKVLKFQEKAMKRGKSHPLRKNLTDLEMKLVELMGWHDTSVDDYSQDEGDSREPTAPASPASSDSSQPLVTKADLEKTFTMQARCSTKRDKQSSPVGKRRRLEPIAQEEDVTTNEFLKLERQKVAALQSIVAAVSGLRSDMQRYFAYVIQENEEHKPFPHL